MVEKLFQKLTIFLSVFIVLILTALIIILNKSNEQAQTSGHRNRIIIKDFTFGTLDNGEEVTKYQIKNGKDFEFDVISYGATLKAIYIKDKNRLLTNVALGFSTLEEYTNKELNPYFGGSIGRVTGRISNAKFVLDDLTYNLDKNNGENYFHGGLNGLNWRNWKSVKLSDGVKFYLKSADGDQGFPGLVYIEAVYRIKEFENFITIEYKANTTKDTPLDLTNHAYFNLAGHYSREKIYNHRVKIYSDKYLDSEPNSIKVTGKINSVTNTKYDFRSYFRLGDRIREGRPWPGDGYDNYFISNQATGDRIISSIKNPSNGIRLDIFSNQNGFMFYTGNFLNVTKPSDFNRVYSRHQGFCFKPHNYPDAVNKEDFPSSILRPDASYYNKIMFKFKVEA